MKTHKDPTWLAAYLVDPTNAIPVPGSPDTYNLPFNKLARGGVEDVQAALDVLKRLAPADSDMAALEAELVTAELQPLPYGMGRCVTHFLRDPKYCRPENLRNFWAGRGSNSFPLLAQAAVRLLSMHTTSCASERNWSTWGSICVKSRNRLALSRAEKLVFVRGNSSSHATPDSTEEEIMQMLEGHAQP